MYTGCRKLNPFEVIVLSGAYGIEQDCNPNERWQLLESSIRKNFIERAF